MLSTLWSLTINALAKTSYSLHDCCRSFRLVSGKPLCQALTTLILLLGMFFANASVAPALQTSVAPESPSAADDLSESSDDDSSATAQEELTEIQSPFLWKFTPENGAPQYLLGTIHVPDERILKLHPAIHQALDEAKELYVELAPADQVSQLQHLTFPAGTRLADKIDGPTLARIDAQLDSMREGLNSRGLPAFRIWAWPLILPNLKAQLSGDGRPVMDMLLVEKAIEREWPVKSLEKVESQLVGFDKLTTDEQLNFLRVSLDSMEEEDEEDEDSLEELIAIYLRGDGAALDAEFKEEFFDESLPPETAEKVFATLMTDRNQVMADTIVAAIKADPKITRIFAAGTGHYVVGPTVVELLEAQGYKFERVSPVEDSQ